jgi:hypothetical protein
MPLYLVAPVVLSMYEAWRMRQVIAATEVTFRPSVTGAAYAYADLDVSSFVVPVNPSIDNVLGTAIAVICLHVPYSPCCGMPCIASLTTPLCAKVLAGCGLATMALFAYILKKHKPKTSANLVPDTAARREKYVFLTASHSTVLAPISMHRRYKANPNFQGKKHMPIVMTFIVRLSQHHSAPA